eukprot:gnl/Spiro4/14300_TR7691_c0_g1_i1.p2 gnl/Spiro4/14300_TR7691_c0_g1~~gnl/Spiro4/14300_TR7691_c0_g1_i1.p2  ORF type:complete len:587 (+),score=173.92 gnl/Spiro4/14300_TR7691_c0_g1_i1:66-1763(+)
MFDCVKDLFALVPQYLPEPLVSGVQHGVSEARTWFCTYFSSWDQFDIALLTCLTTLILLKVNISFSPKAWKEGLFHIIYRIINKFFKGTVDGYRSEVCGHFSKSLNPGVHGPDREKHLEIPRSGVPHDQLLQTMQAWKAEEDHTWKDGLVSGCVYHGGEQHSQFICKVMETFTLCNPLHPDVWPSMKRFEAETVAMTARMLGGGSPGAEHVCGSVSSGGTESIILALRTYREWGRVERGITHPQLIMCTSAHAAFNKGCEMMDIEIVYVGQNADSEIDVGAVRSAISSNTIAIVGSAPSYPHGAIDNIPALSDLALRYGVNLHVDCCLGGFILPWARRLNYDIPCFDFTNPGVTSISADTHKYGFAPKGSSVILYRTPELRKHQWYVYPDWQGGMYCTPTILGSRSGAVSAGAWASMMAMGQDGYMEKAKLIMETANKIRAGIKKIAGIKLLGKGQTMVVAFSSDHPNVNVLAVNDALVKKRHWCLNALQYPPSIHICVTFVHTHAGVAETFVKDLGEVCAELIANPPEIKSGSAAIYGLASAMPVRGVVRDMIGCYLDTYFEAE